MTTPSNPEHEEARLFYAQQRQSQNSRGAIVFLVGLILGTLPGLYLIASGDAPLTHTEHWVLSGSFVLGCVIIMAPMFTMDTWRSITSD